MGVGVAVHGGVAGGSAGVSHDGVEALVLVGRVLDVSHPAVRLGQRVASPHRVAVALLPLALLVAGVPVTHRVVELVRRLRLETNNTLSRSSYR